MSSGRYPLNCLCAEAELARARNGAEEVQAHRPETGDSSSASTTRISSESEQHNGGNLRQLKDWSSDRRLAWVNLPLDG